ncbi:MAG: hypothetical protein KGM47_12120 [Acidobacteriota bacterium]|nr:hypothetical protein [Acidobacteriota bacterium]
MISGNQTWQNALAQPQKQPLYVLEIPDFAVVISSFDASLLSVGIGGYGVALYGIGGYGT